jgi:hypothetical protein
VIRHDECAGLNLDFLSVRRDGSVGVGAQEMTPRDALGDPYLSVRSDVRTSSEAAKDISSVSKKPIPCRHLHPQLFHPILTASVEIDSQLACFGLLASPRTTRVSYTQESR